MGIDMTTYFLAGYKLGSCPLEEPQARHLVRSTVVLTKGNFGRGQPTSHFPTTHFPAKRPFWG